jgi:AAA family ATP:ADP antiporter
MEVKDSSLGFSKWRSFLWPVHSFELKKFVPLLLMYCLIAFCYGALRICKDSLVMTASHSGAETIPFIKVWAILPCALFLTVLFTRLANRYSREKVFYIMMGIFLSFFFIFTFFLFPYQESLHPHGFANQLQAVLPDGFKGFIAIFRNWTFTLFYVMSELWGTAILSVLFWGVANEVTSVSEAKRFYVLWGIGANIAGIFAGQAAVYFSRDIFFNWLPYGNSSWDQSVLFVNCLVMICGVLTMFVFRYLNQHLPPSTRGTSSITEPVEKIKMSMRKNFAYLARSKYLIYIACIVLAYNLSINLIEVVWKNQVKQLYPNGSEYSGYMGMVATWMSVIATAISIFVSGSNFIRRFSWTAGALVTPIITCITGGMFFCFVLCDYFGSSWTSSLFGAAPLFLSVTLGSFHNCMTRACKHTLFDATKEMSFIPLSRESKLKGKAAIDGVGSRLGKSGGAVIHQGLLLIFATVAASTPYVAAIFLAVVLIWIVSATALGKQFDALTGEKSETAINPINA